MFYSDLILAKKGPLAKIWLAAHREKKLKKTQIIQTDLLSSVKAIVNPIEPLSLRLSAHLLLGLVRIQVKKTEYLYKDLNETVIKIRIGPLNSVSSVNLVSAGLHPGMKGRKGRKGELRDDAPAENLKENIKETLKNQNNWMTEYGLDNSLSNGKQLLLS